MRTSFYVLLIIYLFIYSFFFQLLDCYLEAYHHVFDPKEKKRLAQVCRSRNDWQFFIKDPQYLFPPRFECVLFVCVLFSFFIIVEEFFIISLEVFLPIWQNRHTDFHSWYLQGHWVTAGNLWVINFSSWTNCGIAHLIVLIFPISDYG